MTNVCNVTVHMLYYRSMILVGWKLKIKTISSFHMVLLVCLVFPTNFLYCRMDPDSSWLNR